VLSEQGRDLARRLIDFGNGLFSGLQGLSKDENNRIANLLKQIVLKARELTDLDKKPALEIGRCLEPGSEADPMVRIRRYMTDIAYFREAAHIQSWQPYGIEGIVWETLTYLWREGPQTAEEIAEQISEYRNYDKEDYAAALDELAVRGWAAGEDGRYTITEEGTRIRQGAEDKTDVLYAAPFEALTKPDSQELKNHLEKLAGVIVPPSEENEDDD
jgi:DNA-binding MarR family transcriptional regulator